VSEKWRNLWLLTVGELLAMALWFSASAVVPQLTLEWQLSGSQQSWLTMSVQAGFVVGAIISAVVNLADRIRPQYLIAASTLAGAACTAAIAMFADSPDQAMVLRMLTGVCLAGVYPPGMKLVASWSKRDRGLGIGLLVGALTIGSASPHLINALPILGGEAGMPPWRSVLLVAAAAAGLGALLVGAFVQPGPELPSASRFNWRYATRALGEQPSRLANFGYLGHMWELYAMWTWVPLFLIASYEQAGWGLPEARLAGFSVIAVGGVGSVLAGKLADRWGRCLLTVVSLVISGSCALIAGFFFNQPGILTVVCLVWGFAVVADSAQFSAAVSELTDSRYVGTALTIQTSAGFLLTLITIQVIPSLVAEWGWKYVFMLLAAGPVFGIWSMLRLRRMPESSRMAGGRR
jgi:MFS family permease